MSLLSGNTKSAAASASGVGSLSSDLELPKVTETSMAADLLEALDVFTEFGVPAIADEVRPGSVSGVLLPVKEPFGNTVLRWPGEDVADLVDFSLSELSSAFVDVDLGDFEGQDRESTADTLDGSDGEGHLLLSVDVGVENTKNMDEVLLISYD